MAKRKITSVSETAAQKIFDRLREEDCLRKAIYELEGWKMRILEEDINKIIWRAME